MKQLLPRTLSLSFILFLSGCAASYRPIEPPSLNYTANDSQTGIEFAYRYDVLQEKGNKKYAKKEDVKDVKLVAVKLTNNTAGAINVGRDISFYAGQRRLTLLDPMVVKNTLRQIVPAYLPYLLLTFVNFYVSNGTSTQVYPIGLVLGPGITIGNMVMAGTANKNMLIELNQYNLINKDIQKGETVYGIIGINNMGYDPLTVKMTEK